MLWQDLDLFNDYELNCPEDGNHCRKVGKRTRIFKFPAGLNIEFDEVRGRIIGRQPLPSIEEVFFEVMRGESRISVMLGKKIMTAPIEKLAFTHSCCCRKSET